MNAERLNEVARIVEGLSPRDGTDGDWISGPFQRTGTQMLVADADLHTRITHLHMGVYHGSQDCGTIGCIAGVTIQRWPEEAATYAASSTNVAVADDVAGQILGLRPEVAEVLFHCRNHKGYWALGLIRPEEAASACRRLAAGETLDHIWEESLPASGEAH